MRELNNTGFIINRVRMITASFLCKHLLIDWRFGEVFICEKLFDYELSSNNGNWQWAAGCGCDVMPHILEFSIHILNKKNLIRDLIISKNGYPSITQINMLNH